MPLVLTFIGLSLELLTIFFEEKKKLFKFYVLL